MSVSPVGVTLQVLGNHELATRPISIKMTDGSVQEFDSECAIVTGEVNLNTCHLTTDTSKVESVVVMELV